MIGGAAVDAAQQLRAAMDEVGARTYAALAAARQARPLRRARGRRWRPAPLDPETGQGPSFEVQVFSVQLAEVEVNVETGEVTVVRMTSAADPGTVIHPLNVEGQLEGGMDMGVGFALREEYVAGKTKDWVTFKFPTMRTPSTWRRSSCETPARARHAGLRRASARWRWSPRRPRS